MEVDAECRAGAGGSGISEHRIGTSSQHSRLRRRLTTLSRTANAKTPPVVVDRKDRTRCLLISHWKGVGVRAFAWFEGVQSKSYLWPDLNPCTGKRTQDTNCM